MNEVSLSDIHFVEDSNDEVFVSRLLLKKQRIGINLVHHSGMSSFRAALDAKPADAIMLAFVDLNMPAMKGTEIIASILDKAKDDVIMGICSGSEDPEDIRLSFNAGASFFVNKPLGRQAIENVCKSVSRLSLRENADESVDIIVRS
ncbi:response regulator [Hoeflea sp. AS60]|uniref:response regulator n=1 Tax=Hoeflea sp. AS60 TaxID=3135780 RepID=UPI00316D78A2